MKKVILLLMIAAVVFSCKKTETTTTPVQPEQSYAEVTFNVNQIIPEADRDFPFGLPECSDADPLYAHIIIKDLPSDDATGVIVYEGDLGLFTLPNDPNMYTQAVKLMLDGCVEGTQCCNTFYVTQFMVYAADGDDPDDLDDLIYAAPLAGSDAQGFLDYPDRMLDLDFTICEFTKYQFDIDVLCYEDAWYLEFGFVWFNVHEVVMCELCFFVDVCESAFPVGTIWGDFYTPAFDMIGIFGITAEKLANDGVTWVAVEGLQDEFGKPIYTNYDWQNFALIDGPLCIPFANYLDEVDEYRFFWHVWLPDGAGDFCWRTWGYDSDTHHLIINDNCDYTGFPGIADNNVIELVVTDGLVNSCVETPSIDWYTTGITGCNDFGREIGIAEFYSE